MTESPFYNDTSKETKQEMYEMKARNCRINEIINQDTREKHCIENKKMNDIFDESSSESDSDQTETKRSVSTAVDSDWFVVNETA